MVINFLIYLYGFTVAFVIFCDKKDIDNYGSLASTALLAALWPIAVPAALLRKIIR